MKKTKSKSKRSSKRNNRLFLLPLIGVTALAVLLFSVFTNAEVRTFLSKASEPYYKSPTQKNKRLDPGNNERPTPGDSQPTQKPGSTSAPVPTTPSGATVTPQAIPTAGQEVCRIDGRITTDCRCPDMRGLKCGGEETKYEWEGTTYSVPNFYWITEGRDETDTEGMYLQVKGSWIYRQSSADYAKKKAQPNCVEWCIGKPVIYLYPEVPTYIDVSVSVPGRIYISEPLYPEGGWKDVLAQPNGDLTYEGKYYRDLYYETDLDGDLNPPENGIIIPREKLKEKLLDYTQKLGLNEFESGEFVEYWVPQLEEMNSPYVLFSILDQKEKERIDTVHINPPPQTFIAFIAYFKPVYELYKPLPLVLPETPPLRTGYTAVEWGGTIDTAEIRE